MWDRYTLRRKMNSLARRAGWTWAPALPIRGAFASTSRCNLRCRTCYRFPNDDPSVDMFPEVYERVRRQVLPGLEEVCLTGAGEPFLAPIFYRMLEDTLSAGKRVMIVTNGTILRRDCLERLVRTPSRIMVSLDGTTPEVMEHIRPGAQLERVLEFMRTVKELRNGGGHPGFDFQISFVVTRSNVEQLTDCVELAHRYGVGAVNFVNFRTEGRTDEFARESLMSEPNEALPHWERASRRGLELGVQVPPIVFNCPNQSRAEEERSKPTIFDGSGRIRQCPLPWWNTIIETDGLVKPCCAILEPFGNLMEQSFQEIWNGPKYRQLRRTVNTPNMPEACRRCFLPVRF